MTSLRQVLEEKLGDRAARYKEQDIDALVANGYSDKEALEVATREGLDRVGLTPATIDELLAKFSGAAQSSASGRLTSSEILNANLPQLRWKHQGAAASSTGGSSKYYVPDNVKLLECLPDHPDKWQQEAISLQNDPAVERWAPPLVELGLKVESEADILNALTLPLDLLSKICNRPGGQHKVDGWKAEVSKSILQGGLAHHSAQHPEESVHDGGNQPTTGDIGNSSKGLRTSRVDLLLMLDQEQQQPPQAQQLQPPQGQQQQPPEAQEQQSPEVQQQQLPPLQISRPVAVGELEKPTILTCPVGTDEWKPIELVQGFHHKEPMAVRVVCQMFTYLLLHELQFGFISCYFWTWVCHLTPDRKTMYISQPVSHNSKSTSQAPAATFMGAVHWVQTNGLRTHSEEVAYIDLNVQRRVDQYLLPAYESSQEASQPPPSDDPSDPDYEPGAGPGGSSRGGDDRSAKRRKGDSGAGFGYRCINDGSGSQLQGRMRDTKDMQLSTAPNRLQLKSVICSGSLGLVMHGTFNGRPAVIKLCGPDRAGVEACRNEARVYGALQSLQGTVVPQLLGWGQLPVGVCYLATALVDGAPLSSLRRSQQPVAAATAAAVRSALQKISSVQPGFLHGDLRLANILLLRGTQDSATPTAMFIDFATSRLNGSRFEVRMQRRELKVLLSRTS